MEFKIFDYLADGESANGFSDDIAENVNHFDDAKDYLVDNFKIVEENFKRLWEKRKIFILYSKIAKDYRRVILEKINDFKSLYIVHVQDIIWSPPQYRTNEVEGLRETIISLIGDFVKKINEGLLNHRLEEFRADIERAVSILNDVKAGLLGRVNELNSLFDIFYEGF